MGSLFSVDLPDQEGERLDTSDVNPVGYGKVLARVKGMARIPARLIHQLPIVETVHEEEVEAGGKGGGTSSYTKTTYTYSATFAVMICPQKIQGVRRIWLNSKLFYENRPFMSGTVAQAREAAESFFNVYHGTEDQMPDPILQARYGDATPAYRGRAYIVFQDIQLEEFGNRVPSVEVEVVENGTGSTYDTVYPYPLYLRDLVGDICVRSGIPPTLFDVSELSDTITGYSFTSSGSGMEQLEPLMALYNFFPQEKGEKLVFKRDPVPVERDEYNEPCLINEDGLLVNAYHDVLGRQGYFPSEAGTSEGQFLMLRAAALAVKYVNDSTSEWRGIMDNLRRGVDGIYNQTPPTDTDTLYSPHWLYNCKAPVAAQSEKLNVKIYLEPFAGGWTAFIPAGYPNFGESIKQITRIYSDRSSWVTFFNPFAGVNGGDYGVPVSVETDETGTTLVLQGDSSGGALTANAMVIYNFGPVLNVSQNMEAWPYWRPLEPGEIDCAVDVMPWALECFELLADVTGEQQYTDAYNATEASIYTVFDVDDGRAWFKPRGGEPLNTSGAYVSSSRPGFGDNSLSRSNDLGVLAVIPEGEGEAQVGRGLRDSIKETDTGIRVRLNYELNAPGLITLFIQSGPTIDDSVRYFVRKNLPAGVGTIDEVIPIDEWFGYEILGGWGWRPVVEQLYLEPGRVIDVVGYTYQSTPAARIELLNFRPVPELQLPYSPHIAPYTANSIDGQLIEWRGAPGIGYQDPVVWSRLNNSAGLKGMLDFMEDSQNEYFERYGQRGPFMPSYVWDRFDLQATDAAPNTWTFDWVDPNSQWVGYTARAVAALAESAHLSNNSRAALLASYFLAWLESEWQDPDQYIPTNFPETLAFIQRSRPYSPGDVATPYNGRVYRSVNLSEGGSTAASAPNFPTAIGSSVLDGEIQWLCIGYTYGTIPAYGDYDEPHAAALFMRAAAYLHLHGTEQERMVVLIDRLWDYLERLWGDAYGEVAGTWSHNPANAEWFGFWSGEIVTVLAKFLGPLDSVRAAVGIPRQTIEDRLKTHAEWIAARSRTVSVESLEDVITSRGFDETRTRESELPRRVELDFPNSSRNGQDDTRYIEKRSASSEDERSFKSPVYMSGDEALQICYTQMLKAHSQRTDYEFSLIDKTLQPGDVREYMIDNVIRRMQFREIDLSAEGVAEVKAHSYDPTAFTFGIAGSGDPAGTTGVNAVAGTIGVILDIPLYRDDLDSIGVSSYPVPLGSNWRGAGLFTSTDDVTYTANARYLVEPTHGIVNAPLLVKSPDQFDRESRLVVTLENGTLSSVSDGEFLAGKNLALVGNEIIFFKDAAIVGAGQFEISTIARGRCGTRDRIYGHVSGERFILLSSAGIADVPLNENEIGVESYYKAVSVGQTEADVEPLTFTPYAERLKPFAPVHLKARKAATGITVTWIRQTRLSAEWRDGVDAVLGEASELYRAYLRDGIGGDILRTHEITSPSVFFSYEELDGYFGPGDERYLEIVQVSAVVGDGKPAGIVI
ncbi:MAG: hypothetical protein CMI01_00170 [Oceanospirillaceae bacterium]|nr:hypothetical protein [Oceanospirillaceae bacterium]